MEWRTVTNKKSSKKSTKSDDSDIVNDSENKHVPRIAYNVYNK